jgi:hypothetical protein
MGDEVHGGLGNRCRSALSRTRGNGSSVPGFMRHHTVSMRSHLLRQLSLVATFVAVSAPASSGGLTPHRSDVLTCAAATSAEPKHGVAYEGVVTNDDYHFSAVIPNGLTGWGAASNAPFHGFAVFFSKAGPPERTSCITLYVGLELTLPEDPPRSSRPRPGYVPVKIGNRRGVQYTTVGSHQGVRLENVTVLLDLPRDGYTNGLRVALVTPLVDREKTEPIFRAFLSSFRLW